MSKPITNPLYLSDEELQKAIETLFFAYQNFTYTADNILSDYGFGRAHHRAIYFIGRHSGITLSELLGILKISKQSLNRVLRILLAEGFINQQEDEKDKRKKSIYLSNKGLELNKKLIAVQKQFIASAYRKAGPESAQGFIEVLMCLAQKNHE